MVEFPKIDKPAESANNTVIMSSPQVKPDDVVIEHEVAPEGEANEPRVRKQKEDPLAELRGQMEAAEKKAADEREKRVSAERERDAARSQVETTKTSLAKSESEKVATQEAAILARLETAKAEVENAERALEEAIDTGKPAREQIALQKKLADAVYTQRGAEGAKTHFDNWKEREKNKPAAVTKPADDGMTPAARAWIDSHPRYNTDKKYRRTAVAAHEDALEDGIAADSNEYFKRINAALADAGLEGDGAVTVATPVKRQSSGTSTAAPVSQDSMGAGASGGNAAEEKRTGRRTFKLDENMRNRALAQYGKNSTFKLSDEEAYKRYAARMLEIRDKRANGERI